MGNVIISYTPSKKASVIIQRKGAYLIRNIKIYDKNGVILNFDIDEIEDNISNIEIKGDIIYKIKENFFKKDNYIKKDKSGYYYNLYVCKENVDLVYSNFKNYNGLIYREYFLNDIKVKSFESSLLDIKYYLTEKIEEERKKLNTLYSPIKEENLKDNFKRIKKDIFFIEE